MLACSILLLNMWFLPSASMVGEMPISHSKWTAKSAAAERPNAGGYPDSSTHRIFTVSMEPMDAVM